MASAVGSGFHATEIRRARDQSKDKLMLAIANGHERVAHAAEKVTEARLAERHPVDLAFRDSLPTVGDLLAHLMTTHPAGATWAAFGLRAPHAARRKC